VAKRAQRPSDFAPREPELDLDPDRRCPFCPGHEDPSVVPLDIVDHGDGWQMRVIPNLYPAFDGDAGFVVHHLGPVHVTADASGVHEVFVYTPDHHGGLDQLDDEAAAELMAVVHRRLAAHAAAPEVRYTQVIINHGREAGASLVHPHAQILGLPFVPGEILDEERAFARFAGGCVICTTIEAELSTDERVVFADDDVVCAAPFWSGAPFELLLMPREHGAHLQDAGHATLSAIGRGIRDAVKHLNAALGDIAYNVGFHTAPHEHGGQYHWHVHLWPTLVTAAGFERGTGVMINVMPPETAAETLRAVCTPA
jgi:UDPglucose--hexose-1-phosphate uridylyltransferase